MAVKTKIKMAKKGKRGVESRIADSVHKPADDISVVTGSVGTNLYSGFLRADYQEDWLTLAIRVQTIERMVNSDATIYATLEALKTPILSASYFIVPGGDYEKALEIADFIKKALFEELRNGYKFSDLLYQSLTFLEFGFSLFEKVYKVKGNQVFWDRFEPRLQSSILRWSIVGEDWTDGHPAGITQILGLTDDRKDAKEVTATIPWNKIMRFTFRQRDNNYEGTSVLRSAYLHWVSKQLLYRIANIQSEREGVGIPVIKFSKDTPEPIRQKYEEVVRNIRANEESFVAIDNSVESLEFMSSKGKNTGVPIIQYIEHHDKKIYDSVKAGFLNLSSGDGGSNALSKDQSSFFLRTLQWIANYVCDVISEEIKELVYINFGAQEKYPRLDVSEIGNISMDELSNSITKVKEAGLITWSVTDEEKLREQLRLPPLSDEAREMLKMKQELEEDMLKKGLNPETANAIEGEYDKGTEADEVEQESEEAEGETGEDQGAEDEKVQSEQKFADDTGPKPTKREKQFVKNISDFENYLEGEFGNIQAFVTQKEQKISEALKLIYSNVDVIRNDGIKSIARTAKNKQLERKAIEFVNSITKQLEEKLLNSPIQDRLFNTAKRMAVSCLKADEALLDEIYIDEAKFNSFITGYKSNVEGVLFNEPRKIRENITLNFGSQVSVDLAISQASSFEFNKNILKLSTVTHARAAYNALQFEANAKRGLVFYKVLVPAKYLKTLNASGMTADVLYRVVTAGVLNEMMHESTDGKNTDAIKGLGLHHGSFTYYMGIPSKDVGEEQKLSKKQRADLQATLQNKEEE